MADIDLIPREYRYWLWQLACLKTAAAALLVLLALATASYCYLDITAAATKHKLHTLQREKAVTQQQQSELEQLSSAKQELARQWRLLNGLRGGASVESILMVIDRALLDNQVWFLDWQFSRAGYMPSTGTGNFVIASDSRSNNSAASVSWDTGSHINIKGQAIDHAAFSGFVQRLLAQAEITDVKIVRTNLSRGSAVSIVEFDIAILVNSRAATS